ncbi:MAG: GIY-YIG nuclease family protein [candidate division WOR-3 bacterium]
MDSQNSIRHKKSYILLINNSKTQKIYIGKLGGLKFCKGYYSYLGSAKKNIFQRIKRHLSKDKKIFWHIDYFLTNKSIKIKEIWIGSSRECKMAQQFLKHGFQYINRFGSSDCGCPSHLFILDKNMIRIKNILKKNGFEKFNA